jgi:predicted house-cleaning NTP pyrophosphatase (Maf/HAM1 superfamily)
VPFLARQIDDTGHEPGGPITNVRRNAARRALAARSEDPSEVLLGIDRRIMLGTHSFAAPPADAATARAMLMALSGQVHHVVTAVALVWQGRVRTAEAVTAVTVRQLSAELIDGYLAQGRWVGRLGAYDVTGGSVLIQRVEGDYQNLTGIPPAALLDVYPALLESRRAPNLRYSWPSVA